MNGTAREAFYAAHQVNAAVLRLGALLFLAILAITPSAAQASTVHEFEATVTATGPVRYVGEGNGTLELQAAITDYASRDIGFTLQTQGARLVAINYPVTYASTYTDSPLGYVQTFPQEGEQSTTYDSKVKGKIALQDVSDSTFFRASPGKLKLVGVDGHFDFNLEQGRSFDDLAEVQRHYNEDFPRESLPADDPFVDGYGSVFQPSSLPALRFKGDSQFIAFGGNVTVTSQGRTETIRTGAYESSETVYAPGRTVKYVTLNRVVLTLEGPFNANLTGTAWRIASTGMDVDLTGDLTFTKADAEYEIDGKTYQKDAEIFQAIGTFSAKGRFGTGYGDWAVAGQASFVGVDTKTVVGSRTAHLSVPMTAATVAVGLGLAAWGFYVLGLNQADPYRGEVRQQIIHYVTQHPGATPAQLRAHTGVGRTAVSHHLRVLLNHGVFLEKSLPQQKISSYALNSMSFEFKLPVETSRHADLAQDGWSSPTQAVNAHVAMQLVNDPKKAGIFQALQALGAATYADIKAHWLTSGHRPMPHATFNYHVAQLLEHGILAKRSAANKVQYRFNLDLALLRKHQMEGLMTLKGNLKIFLQPILGNSGLERERVQAAVAAQHGTRVARRTARALTELMALGYLTQDVTGRYQASDRARAGFLPT